MRSIEHIVSVFAAAAGFGLTQARGSAPSAPPAAATALKNYGVSQSVINALEAAGSEPQAAACQVMCNSLTSLYGAQVLAQNSTAYTNFTGSFWSVQQAEVRPGCVFKPTVNTQVAVVVLASQLSNCPFAAKIGGHAAMAGASSSPGGVTIWFTEMNEVTLNSDQSVAAIGPGNVWGTVYEALEPYGLAVIGGRASSIGVGGFVTGGGISWYSNIYGWALDNVHSYEVVTANGNIVTASPTQNTDLYWGLRGGGNNLGLVTQFNLNTVPSPMMRGGARTFDDNFDAVITAFVNMVNNATNDGNALYYIAFLSTGGMNLASAELAYVKNETDPAIYQEIRNIPAISDTTVSKTLVQYCKDVDSENPNGLREVYWPISTLLNEEFAQWAIQYFFQVVPQVANVTGAEPVIIYQALSEPVLQKMASNGGNALGLDASKGPLHLLHMSFWWQNESDDETVYTFANNYWNTVIAKAKSMGIYNEYIYMNYASQYQDVIAGYGATSKSRLQQVASKYDPNGVFQTLQPGYFKLNRAPAVFPY